MTPIEMALLQPLNIRSITQLYHPLSAGTVSTVTSFYETLSLFLKVMCIPGKLVLL